MKPRDPQTRLKKRYSLIPILAIFASSFANGAAPKPNLIIVFCDDLGYADIGPFGSKTHATPVLDRMAEEGMRLTDFYSTCPVCTPSRSSLMTGCYPRRVNMQRKNLCVLFPLPDKRNNDCGSAQTGLRHRSESGTWATIRTSCPPTTASIHTSGIPLQQRHESQDSPPPLVAT